MEEMMAAIHAATTPTVQLWMNWMFFVFVASLLFVWKYKQARWAALAFALGIPLSLYIYNSTGSPHMVGLAHIILWMPLLIYLYKFVIQNKNVPLKSVFGVWVILLCATIVISLVFDVRDVYLVLSELK